MKIYPDKIVLWNEGALPDDIKIADLKKSHPSCPRNELLADVFFKAGLIETWGRGTIKITNECKKAGLPEPEFKEEFGGFSIYFYKDIYTEEILTKMELNERQIEIVKYVKNKGGLSISSLKMIFTDVAYKTLYRDLQFLVKKGILEQFGEKKGRKYKLR